MSLVLSGTTASNRPEVAMQTTLQRFLPVIVLLAASTPAVADEIDGRIFRVDVDFADGTLFVNGQNLPRSQPTVTLGNVRLTVVSFSTTDIVAKVPTDLAP